MTDMSAPSSVGLAPCKTRSACLFKKRASLPRLFFYSYSSDLDLPLECDDEYWENPDPELAFKQPPGKPSTITYFNCYLQLGAVMGYVLRTIGAEALGV